MTLGRPVLESSAFQPGEPHALVRGMVSMCDLTHKGVMQEPEEAVLLTLDRAKRCAASQFR